jgi:phosphoglycerate-specific signal transduction histidine kinase
MNDNPDLKTTLMTLVHDLNQPLLAINAYLGGCLHRLAQEPLQNDDMIHAMKAAMVQVEVLGERIHQLSSFTSQ